MDFLNKVNSQPWLRPAFAALAAIAVVAKTAAPPHTLLHKGADFFLTNIAPPLMAYSVGSSHAKK